ncbi:alpha/beta hydrolase family esterase [Sphingorhabdus sp.]|uniref:extracellular catalytic domain type 1 short-chain-length polyhydroxyalkanoate depolymerase n=1 Tax=Sphingorhabdus sp. TaxID=1902408 RepID=UPI00391CB364
MKPSLDGMQAVKKLTRSGKLLEATALIQQLLSGQNKAYASADKTLPLREAEWAAQSVGLKLSRSGEGQKEANRHKPMSGVGCDPGHFENRQYSCDLGRRSYKLFTPSRHGGELMPLVIMLHGCTQTPDDFAAGTQMNELGEELGFLVAYPAQSSSANPNGCWNWFKTSDQQKDAGEPALIAGIVREIVADYAVDASRVYVAGLSAGGAMAAILGMTYPELFAAIGVHSGLPFGAATDVASAFKAMKRGPNQVAGSRSGQTVPTIVFHGDRDRTVNPANADGVLAQFDLQGPSDQYMTSFENSPNGLKYVKSVQSDDNGKPMFEKWLVKGAGHAWSGGSPRGSYTEPRGPEASREMIRFFLKHKLGE